MIFRKMNSHGIGKTAAVHDFASCGWRMDVEEAAELTEAAIRSGLGIPVQKKGSKVSMTENLEIERLERTNENPFLMSEIPCQPVKTNSLLEPPSALRKLLK